MQYSFFFLSRWVFGYDAPTFFLLRRAWGLGLSDSELLVQDRTLELDDLDFGVFTLLFVSENERFRRACLCFSRYYSKVPRHVSVRNCGHSCQTDVVL